ncbi:MAG: hypothetical protein GWN62_28460, partial [Aliifodinibius sp.]|nr:hypothetical protein [Fodinibius sp.]
MNIYLLPRKKGKYLLYSKEFQVEPLRRRRPAKPNDSEQSDRRSRLLNLIKSGYKTATAPRERSEKLLKEMRELSQITVYYPANLSEDKACDIYHHIIQSQIKKHKRWLIVDGALLPLSAIFSLIPGPNVLMAYLAWRTLMHYKTKKGGERAAFDLEICFVKDHQLETLFEIVNRRFVFSRAGKIKAIGEEIG